MGAPLITPKLDKQLHLPRSRNGAPSVPCRTDKFETNFSILHGPQKAARFLVFRSAWWQWVAVCAGFETG
ncbi:hypothetical protein PILCRDRAFT_99590 [Piloderma croceum F 1598]|uniref:Uncharacterized protein n=1 Tax=Piloderma croceum (strain F 1598) TaxID=765440 RepID=A0A0C3GJJ8_PILCF|nr:hypothetical protein PILCRDRAFT_99590 [Piloderma croceum F 1598]